MVAYYVCNCKLTTFEGSIFLYILLYLFFVLRGTNFLAWPFCKYIFEDDHVHMYVVTLISVPKILMP